MKTGGPKPDKLTGSAVEPTAVVNNASLCLKETRELEHMPGLIASLEKRQKELENETVVPGLYQSDGEKVAKVTTNLESAGEKLDGSFLRWEELETGP